MADMFLYRGSDDPSTSGTVDPTVMDDAEKIEKTYVDLSRH